ncbi:hypothetical protein Salat_2392300 [Sesamum alatum]|uniref:Uncharacterized protein n=1 Tax=Sesamum alatum TaxID=300844 RepID=A0AAE2CF23_9LAMI|nr:hypothetical protein Salat_2392300 [Sesamum alatum]
MDTPPQFRPQKRWFYLGRWTKSHDITFIDALCWKADEGYRQDNPRKARQGGLEAWRAQLELSENFFRARRVVRPGREPEIISISSGESDDSSDDGQEDDNIEDGEEDDIGPDGEIF